MSTDASFYKSFRDDVLAGFGLANDANETTKRVSFQLHQYKMIPPELENMFCNLTRGFPTPPIYAFLGIGSIGTNIARYAAVHRPGSHRSQAERTGTFYKFIAPS